MYNVGFGDCFLLSLEYDAALEDGRRERHILLDFGSSRRSAESMTMAQVARLIEHHCAGHLDVIVVSHRHRDHLSGFGDADPATIIEGLRPGLVVRPWTEDPAAGETDTAPRTIGPRSQAFIATLGAAESFAAEVVGGRASSSEPLGFDDLAALAFDQLTNAAAVKRLDGWASSASAAYVFHGSPSRIEEFVPGVRVRVLGPPTLEQSPSIWNQRTASPDYWVDQRRLLRQFHESTASLHTNGVGPGSLAPSDRHVRRRHEPAPSWPEQWLINRLRERRADAFLSIVRTLDDALNNTSLILLIEIGDKQMLFAGDAQIENWMYALRQAPDAVATRERLREVDLYKVGHHGSRNGTPRTLYRLWERRSRKSPMVALMSTQSGAHGRPGNGTEVPRLPLVEALTRVATLYSTESLSRDRPFLEVVALRERGGFRVTEAQALRPGGDVRTDGSPAEAAASRGE